MASVTKDWTPMDDQDEHDADFETGPKAHEEDHDVENTTQLQHILVDIVSALRVPSMDSKSEGDPYVQVKLGDKKIHETKVLENNSNPIWTLETGSLFLIPLDKEKVDLDTAVVSFVVMDHNKVLKKHALGSVEVKVKDMINGTGKRKVLRLNLDPEVISFNEKKKRFVSKQFKLVLRYKIASLEEVHFVETLNTKKLGVFASETFLPPTISSVAKLAAEEAKITGWGAKALAGRTEIDAKFLERAMQPSEEWIEVGSGTHGRVYVEVIGCDNLPNMDAPTIRNPNNKTDAFCCLIMEDSIVHTTIINDSLFPRWLPNDHRAFIFHVHHPSSQLYIGVFDHDKINRVGNSMRQRVHDPIGRVLVNISQFRPGTLYTLHYHLYLVDHDSEKNRADQTHNGTLMIRLRIDWGDIGRCKRSDATNMLIEGMSTPQEVHIAVPHKYDFHVAQYTTVGMDDPNIFSMKMLTDHVEEIQSYVDEEVILMIANSAVTVLLWRGHYEVRFCGCKFFLPLHSMMAFAWGVLVTQNYNRVLSFILFTITWFFLATNEYRRSHPSPWHKCKSFAELLGALLGGICCGCFGSTLTKGGTTIKANENLAAIDDYYAAVKERRAQLVKQKEISIEQTKKMEEDEMKKQMEMDATAIGNVVNIASGQKDSLVAAMNPLKPILHPVQKLLFNICCYLRITKSIIMWEENYYPFWIAIFSFLGAVLCFFIPWGLILRWLIRITVWIVLGPWMKVVDWLFFGKAKDMSEEKKKMLQDELRNRYQQTLQQRMLSQKLQEKTVKFESMLKYLFGKYPLRVPRFRESKFLDYPLPTSAAEPFDGPSEADLNIVGQICGQRLAGNMIPTRMIADHPFVTEEPEDSTSFLRVWASRKKDSERDEQVQGEEKPLLSGKRGKKKKWYGLFPKWRK